MHIAFATTSPDRLGHEDSDRPWHEEAFARAGIDLDYRCWWDSAVAWEHYDLVVIRSPWDYVPHLHAYRRWLGAMDQLGTLRNAAPLVEWNIDKRYLLELAAVGVPVITTRIATSEEELAGALSSIPGEVVVKPVVSAGSADTGRFAPGDPGARALGRRVLGRGTPVMVQPAVVSVATEGEIGTVLFRGAVSHSFRKGPLLALGGGRLGDGHVEQVSAVTLCAEQERAVQATVDAVTRIATEQLGLTAPLLYSRVDMVRDDHGVEVVLEVELNEPSFFLSVDPGAADRFVAATVAEVGA